MTAVDAALAREIVQEAVTRYCKKRESRIDSFARENFSFLGSLRLHRHAVGLDMIRAPVNLAMSAPFLTSRIVAAGCRKAGRKEAAEWIESRRYYLKTDVARELEWRLFVDFLELPFAQGARTSERDALAEELLRDPRVEGAINEQLKSAGVKGDDPEFRAWLSGALNTYQSTRVSSADMSNALLGAGVGAIAFKQLTPGMMSLGPVAAHALVQSAAIASFPLGAGIGGVWYGLFPAVAPAALTVGATGGLVAFGAVFSAFSGVISDPVQRRLGIHQRRLRKLLNSLEQELRGEGEARFTVRDHYVARILDLLEGLNVIRTMM
ncbi:MAG: hypothetical protein HOM52_17045 [Rhodospirillaceae bacterium]|nr:hypothetical protein [Rhodospirillaceae bacterium]MBT5040212.1 hypothetical protein [Rhodospirillaceae bacterium]MBT6830728.1 hypothetical protein [Rhodospirillaceae bacterium]MBT7293011.1 hypothetical protein [Rhodospirillaceae bacterium]